MAISVSKPTVGGSESTWGTTINTGLDTIVDALNGTAGTVAPDLSTLTIGGTDVTATAAEINALDGVTATTAELNILDGVTATTAELNILDGVTATAAEINILDGVTATTAEINYVDGVTSAIQTQLDAKYQSTTQAEATWQAGTGTTDSLVSPADIKAAILALATSVGVGQSWQTPSRSASTSYQNTTNRAIQVAIAGAASDNAIQVSSNGSTWVTVGNVGSNGSYNNGVTFIVPDDHYYRLNGGSFSTWSELR